MKFDGYSGTIDQARLQRCLEQCSATDFDHPPETERCARRVVKQVTCHCIRSEESICNALTSSIGNAMFTAGHSQ